MRTRTGPMWLCWFFSVSVFVPIGQPMQAAANYAAEASANLMESLKEANELWLKGDATNGIPAYNRLLGPIEKTFGKDSATEGLVLFRIGFLHAAQGDFESALPYLERCQSLIALLPDDESSLMTKGNLYWGLGISYRSLLKHEQAIQAFNQSLDLKQKLAGADDLSLVEILLTVADLHSLQRRPLDAIPLLERALAISEKRFGIESAQAARMLASLGNTKKHAGQFDGAMTCLKRSLEISERVLAATNAQIAVALINLGSLYSDHGEYQQAVPLIERGVKLLEQCYVQGDSQSAFGFAGALHHLSAVQIEVGDYDKGIATLRRSLAITESSFGSASINLVSALNSLAVAYHQQGDFERTLPLLERAQRILKDAPPHKKGELVVGLNNLAELFRDLGKEAEALRLF
jgi:tetratricopeptide (TPR) repeat protein